jgi:uncharacterized repeat protein (TIGR04076 family)
LDLYIEVVRVRGTCNAGLREGDIFVARGSEIVPQSDAKPCPMALTTIMMNAGRITLERRPIYVSCPDPGTGEGGNVILCLYSKHEDHMD